MHIKVTSHLVSLDHTTKQCHQHSIMPRFILGILTSDKVPSEWFNGFI